LIKNVSFGLSSVQFDLNILMRNLFFILLLLSLGVGGNAQNKINCESFIETLEVDIVFNEYLEEEKKVEKIEAFLSSIDNNEIDSNSLCFKYAEVNLSFTKDDNDQVLYDFLELTERCDLSKPIDLRIYLGSLLQISSVFRKNNAIELSLQYIEKGIDLIEQKNLNDYPWIQDFYNNAGVDFLSMGNYKLSQKALNKALEFKGERDYLQDAMIEYNLSFLNYELGLIDSAIFYQKNTCFFLEKINDLDSYPELYSRYGNSLGSLALFYYINNESLLAQETALKAKQVFSKVESFESGRYPYLFVLINVGIDEKNKVQIDSTLSEIKFVAEKVDDGKFNFYQLLSDSYKAIGNKIEEINYLGLAYNQFQIENIDIITKLENYNTKLQAQILQSEKIRFQNEKDALNKKALLYTSIISLIFVFFIIVLYLLYARARTKSDLLEKEIEIAKIKNEKNKIKAKLTESELNEKRLITKRLASHIKLKQETETAFLQKIKELRLKKPENIEAEITELQIKMVNLINIDQNLEENIEVNDLNQEFIGKLKKAHPELSKKELQFCTYLLLDLSAKEIGSITNQSDGAIRVYKNRIKNKLFGKKDINIVDYLQNI